MLASECPVAHVPNQSTDQSPTVIVIVVEEGKIPETDGFIATTLPTDTNLSNLRHTIAKRCAGSIILPESIRLIDANNTPVTTIQQLSELKVVYIAGTLTAAPAPLVPGYPIIGVVPMMIGDFRSNQKRMYDEHGDTIRYYVFNKHTLGTRDPEVARVMMDDSEHFYKNIAYPFSELREIGGQGLFTTSSKERIWELSHRLLMPAFSASAMKIYANEMLNVADRAVLCLADKLGSSIEVIEYTTNITFETIGAIGFGYDFHLLDPKSTEKNPFLVAMNYCLRVVMKRFMLTALWKHLPLDENTWFQEQMQVMRGIIQQVIDERRNSDDAKNMKKDLLGFMLNAKAPGEDGNLVGLSDDIIFDQLITLGIAGSDTTANTLSWILYLLDKHPGIHRRVLQELANADITPDQPISVKQANSLKYLTQVIKETLRMFPPVPALSKICGKTCVLPGGYIAYEGMRGLINVWSLHHNEKVYPNAYSFNPDRFSEENAKSIPEGAWLPFSSGPRACLGMSVAMIEMRVVLARLLSKYEFRTVDGKEVTYDPNSITTKPLDLHMTVHKRTDFPKPSTDSVELATTSGAVAIPDISKISAVSVGADELPRTYVLFGSNMGTSEGYAVQIAEQLSQMGYRDLTVQSLDEWDISAATSAHGKSILAIVITSTYNGVPPDNATRFSKWLDLESRTNLLGNIDYALFGCGNSMWRTFQKFPRHVFTRLSELGATPLSEFQFGDSNDDLDEDFLQWSLRICATVVSHYGSSTEGFVKATTDKSLPFNISLVDDTVAPFRIAPENAAIKINQELQDIGKSGRSTRHIEITLDQSSGIQYQTGDHLNVHPVNAPGVVREVAAILKLDLDSAFTVERSADASRYSRSAAAATHGHMCTVSDALQYVCDWKEAPSRELIVALSELAGTGAEYSILRAAAEDVDTLGKQSPGWNALISQTRTVLDVLRQYASLAHQVPFGSILHFVSAMTPRRYSIASCQSVVGNEVHLSVAIVDDIVNGRSYGGLATGYLASLEPGSRISVSHRPAQAAFHLPPSSNVPVMLVGAGTGVAPFRGFLQEMKYAGIGGAALYFGCRSPEYDYLYKGELEQYVQDGTLAKLQTAFSRIGNECKYVQHHISADGADVWNHLQSGGRVYVCGSADKLAKDVVSTMLHIFQNHGLLSDGDAATYLSNLVSSGQYIEDVW